MVTPSNPPPPPSSQAPAFVIQQPRQKTNWMSIGIGAGALAALGLTGYGIYSYLNSQNQTNQLAGSTCGQAYKTAYSDWMTLYAQAIKQYPGGIPAAVQAQLDTLQKDMTQALNCMTTLAAQSDTTGSIGYAVASLMNSAAAELVAAGVIGYLTVRGIAAVISARGGAIRGPSQSIQAAGSAISQEAEVNGDITSVEAAGARAALSSQLTSSLGTEAADLESQVEFLLGQRLITTEIADALIAEIGAAETVAELDAVEAIVIAIPK